jgi:hypothetical protein
MDRRSIRRIFPGEFYFTVGQTDRDKDGLSTSHTQRIHVSVGKAPWPLDSDSDTHSDRYSSRRRFFVPEPPTSAFPPNQLVKSRRVNVGPGARFTISLCAELHADDACVSCVLLCDDATAASDGDATGRQQAWSGIDGGQHVTEKSVAVVFRRAVNGVTAEIRASGRVIGEPVHMLSVAGCCCVLVEYAQGCIAVRALTDTLESSSRGARGAPVVSGARADCLIQGLDVSEHIGSEDAVLLCVCNGKNSRESSRVVVTHWLVTVSAYQGRAATTEMRAPESHGGGVNGDAFTGNISTAEGALSSVLAALGEIAQVGVVRGVLQGGAWQDTLWSLCCEGSVDESTREKILMMATAGLREGEMVGFSLMMLILRVFICLSAWRMVVYVYVSVYVFECGVPGT